MMDISIKHKLRTTGKDTHIVISFKKEKNQSPTNKFGSESLLHNNIQVHSQRHFHVPIVRDK